MTTVSIAFIENQLDQDTERSDLGILVHLLRVEEKQCYGKVTELTVS